MTRAQKIISVAVLVGVTASGVGVYERTIAQDPEQQVWCCDSGGGNCEAVASFTNCSADKLAVWCEHGQSAPVSNADGTDGFECLE